MPTGPPSRGSPRPHRSPTSHRSTPPSHLHPVQEGGRSLRDAAFLCSATSRMADGDDYGSRTLRGRCIDLTKAVALFLGFAGARYPSIGALVEAVAIPPVTDLGTPWAQALLTRLRPIGPGPPIPGAD
jgi:hypothetical protein